MKEQAFPFSQQLRENVHEFAAEADLQVVTTPIQEKNGTIDLYDPETNVNYTMYTSGYVRRRYTGFYSPAMYQLNKATREQVTRSYGDRSYTFNTTVRHLVGGEDQLVILKRLVPLFRIHQESNDKNRMFA